MNRAVSLGAVALVVVGALNWGLVGLARLDLVAALFGGPDAPASRVVYGLVGLAAVVLVCAWAAGSAPAARPAAGAR